MCSGFLDVLNWALVSNTGIKTKQHCQKRKPETIFISLYQEAFKGFLIIKKKINNNNQS